MPTMKLTKQAIDGLHPQDKDKFYWDTEVKGFGVKVTPKGRKSFLVQYRPGGKMSPTRKMSLGAYGTVTPHQAKTEATRILGLRAEGRDPAMELKEARRAAVSDRFSDVANDFIEKHVSQNRTANVTTQIIYRDILPKWGARSVHEITKRDINDLLDSVVDRGAPVMANRVLAAIRKFFNWCVSRGIIEISPCNGIAAPHKEKARERVLSDTELRLVVKAAHQIGGAFGAIVLMLVFTAQRLNEVSRMEWQELDLDAGIWTIPGERTKNKKTHNVHLTAHALALLKSAPELGSFVFTTNGKTPFSGFGKAKKRLDNASAVTDWVLHDIRRTVTSGMASIGIAPHIADKTLNHQSGTISGVAAVYQRHEFLKERESALEAWGNYVAALIDGKTRDNVVAIPTK